jgi:lipoate-protein ligase A
MHMALDEVLLMRVAAGERGPTLRFWAWTSNTLVLGANQSVGNEVDLVEAGRLGFELTRRMSGGGTMVCEPGRTVTWSLYLPEWMVARMSFRESYAHLDGWALRTLRELGVEAEYRPINEIVIPGGKVAGAAQARRRGAVLHHVTLAYSIEPELVPRLIRIGRPALGRGARSAERVVASLSSLISLTMAEFVAALQEGFARERTVTSGELNGEEWAQAEALVTTKYATEEWIHRLP